MRKNQMTYAVKKAGITSLAFILSACGGVIEKEPSATETDAGVSDAQISDIYRKTDSGESDDSIEKQLPWYTLMCDDLEQGLRESEIPLKKQRSLAERCKNECTPPGRESSLRFCADLYCCAQAGYVSLCGDFNDSWQRKEFPYSHYVDCMEQFGAKPF